MSPDSELAIPQLPSEDLLRKSVFRHPHNMSRPSCLGREEHGIYRLDASLLKNFSVGYIVLQLDVKEFAQVVELSVMSPVYCPCSTSVE